MSVKISAARFLTGTMVSIGLAVLTSSAEAANKPYKLGFMIWNASIPFYSNLIKGAKDTAAKEGVTVDIQSGNGDLATEIAVVQQFIAQHVDAILVTTSDPKGIVPVVRQANAAKIPVFAVNNRIDTSTGAEVVTHVGVDDVAFGEAQGKFLAEAIGGKGSVAYIMGKLGTSAQLDRKEGFYSVLKASPDIKVVAEQTADWDNAKALAVTQDFLSKYHSGGLTAIVDQGPEGVNAAEFAAKQGRADLMFILGDYPADVRNAIIKGTVYGTVDQDPTPQGVFGVKDAVEWLDGNKSAVPTPNHYLPLPVVTKKNVDQYPAAWGG
jgi:ABC-type sugar transport system substrate-binding protein